MNEYDRQTDNQHFYYIDFTIASVVWFFAISRCRVPAFLESLLENYVAIKSRLWLSPVASSPHAYFELIRLPKCY